MTDYHRKYHFSDSFLLLMRMSKFHNHIVTSGTQSMSKKFRIDHTHFANICHIAFQNVAYVFTLVYIYRGTIVLSAISFQFIWGSERNKAIKKKRRRGSERARVSFRFPLLNKVAHFLRKMSCICICSGSSAKFRRDTLSYFSYKRLEWSPSLRFARSCAGLTENLKRKNPALEGGISKHCNLP